MNYLADTKNLLNKPPFKNKLSGEFMKEGLEELIGAIENNSKPICSGEDALKTLEFVGVCSNNN